MRPKASRSRTWRRQEVQPATGSQVGSTAEQPGTAAAGAPPSQTALQPTTQPRMRLQQHQLAHNARGLQPQQSVPMQQQQQQQHIEQGEHTRKRHPQHHPSHGPSDYERVSHFRLHRVVKDAPNPAPVRVPLTAAAATSGQQSTSAVATSARMTNTTARRLPPLPQPPRRAAQLLERPPHGPEQPALLYLRTRTRLQRASSAATTAGTTTITASAKQSSSTCAAAGAVAVTCARSAASIQRQSARRATLAARRKVAATTAAAAGVAALPHALPPNRPGRVITRTARHMQLVRVGGQLYRSSALSLRPVAKTEPPATTVTAGHSSRVGTSPHRPLKRPLSGALVAVRPSASIKLLTAAASRAAAAAAKAARVRSSRSWRRDETPTAAAGPTQKAAAAAAGRNKTAAGDGTSTARVTPRQCRLLSVRKASGATANDSAPTAAARMAAAAAAAQVVSRRAAAARSLALARGRQAARRATADRGPCLDYCRRGVCTAALAGGCSRVHDPATVAVCTQWLAAGTCGDATCKLQHKLVPELMPTCTYFLEGRCGRRDCPYLHVRLPADAPHCPAFLQGYCSAGVLCPRKHLTPRMLRDAQAAARAAAPAAQQQTVRQQPGGGGGRLSGAAAGGGAHAAAVMPAPPTGLRLSGRLSLSRASSDGSASLRGALAALLPSEEEALCVGDSSDSKSDS